ncbi:MAG: radical SAM protein [Deltaproteobacteria bacterium]|nr:radical SAM protein [Deltaproteobacteria bacterium]
MENSTPAFQALLLQPPPGDLTGPYPALGYLKAYAARQGFRVQVKDLGIEAFQYLTRPSRIAALLDQAASLLEGLNNQPALGVLGQQHYLALLAALAPGRRPRWFADSLAIFRDPDRFYDYREYQNARLALNTFYGLLSAVHFPTALTASEYPSAGGLKTWPAVLEHRRVRCNPYVRYYEEVLFPLLAANPPALVGISMVFANQSAQALVLGRLIKERFPRIQVTMGGAYLSQWAMLLDESRLEEFFQCTDSLVVGEGEEPWAALLAQTASGGEPAGVPNLIYRQRATGKIRRSPLFKYTDIATQPPPDYSDLDLSSYLSPQVVLPYCISRGCYWGKCVFCQNRYGDQEVRRYQTVPVDKAVAEMAALADRYGSNHFNFSNDVIDPQYLKRFSQAVLASGRTFIWNTDLRAEAAYAPEVCRLLARAGLNTVAIGFESGCQRILEAMAKGNRVGTTRQVLKNFYQSGIATQAMGFFGFPGETEADGEKTVRFLEENVDRLSYYVLGLLLVLPGSRMYAQPQRFGVSALHFDDNPLRTPEPVWKSERRLSAVAVNRLYQRLSRLEEWYLLDDYPYVGGLSTNHSFLYFRRGPDILKVLRRQEKERSPQQRPEV